MKIKNWIQNFLGISSIKSALHNMDGDISSIMLKQMNQDLQPLPIDPPECAEDSPYEYVLQGEGAIRTAPGSINYIPEWYCIWMVGFAGPFQSKEEAEEYEKYHELKKKGSQVELLHRHLFVKK